MEITSLCHRDPRDSDCGDASIWGMKLESQVCSLELSKKLKELGVPQKSLFWWICTMGEWDIVGENDRSAEQRYSAYTTDELGEMLPWRKGSLSHGISGGGWSLGGEKFCMYYDGVEPVKVIEERNEVDARAALLIYLLENGLESDKINV